MRQRPALTRGQGSDASDRGAAAVEFALVLPVLLLMLFGIIDFGRLYNAQITLTQASREGARLAALGTSSANVAIRTKAAATGLDPIKVTVTVTTACAAASTGDGKVRSTYPFTFLTPISSIVGLLGAPVTVQATGVMPCET